ncbi:MAG TPA: VanZ family protein [Cellulomonas sp.]
MPTTTASRARVATRVVLGVYLVGLAVITMMPEPSDTQAFGWVRRAIARVAGSTGIPLTFAVVEAVGNVLLFVPFGLLFGLLRGPRRWPWILLAGSATSAAIETVQLAIPGRWTTLQDWILNTLGTAVGLAVLTLVVRARHGLPEATPTT